MDDLSSNKNNNATDWSNNYTNAYEFLLTFLKREKGKVKPGDASQEKKLIIMKTDKKTELGMWSVLPIQRISQGNKLVDKKK